jgi:hypothetical protein
LKRIAVLLLIVLGIACTRYGHKESREENHNFDATGIKIFNVETGNGKITSSVKQGATGRDSADAAEHIDSIFVHITPDTSNSSLRIFVELPEPGTGEQRSYGADVTVFTPESIVLNLETSNGDVSVGDQEADFDLTTSNGDLTTTNTRGYARLNSSNGSITVSRHEGNIQGVTSNGDVNAAVIMPKSDGTCSFKTSNGAVTLAVPDSVGASIWLKTTIGKITVTGFTLNDTNDDDYIFQAQMGDASGTIEVETSNKSIELKELQ